MNLYPRLLGLSLTKMNPVLSGTVPGNFLRRLAFAMASTFLYVLGPAWFLALTVLFFIIRNSLCIETKTSVRTIFFMCS
jgi:hypothetical protein